MQGSIVVSSSGSTVGVADEIPMPKAVPEGDSPNGRKRSGPHFFVGTLGRTAYSGTAFDGH